MPDPATPSSKPLIDTIADGDIIPMTDVSGATPADKDRHATFTKIAAWAAAKWAVPDETTAEAGVETVARFWTAERIKQLAIAVISGTNNWTASAAPVGTNDNTQGYKQGSIWRWALRIWMCVDATTNVAVWVELTGTGTGGGLANVVEDETPQLGGPLDANGHQVREAKGANVASSSALAIGDDGNYFIVTGTTAIETIATKGVGTEIELQFAGILTLTHSTDLILPTAANITTAVGDVARFREVATGDWRCVNYQRASGAALSGSAPSSGGIENLVEDETPQLGGPLDANGHQIREAKGTDVASASELAIGNDGNFFNVTGTTTIATISAKGIGTEIELVFAGALTLTHSTDLVLPTAADIVTVAGDVARFREYAAGDWRCTHYQRSSGQALAATSSTAGVPSATVAYTSATTLALSDAGKRVTMDTDSGGDPNPWALTVAPQASVAWPANTTIWVQHVNGSGEATIVPGSGVSIGAASITLALGEIVQLYRISENSWMLLNRQTA